MSPDTLRAAVAQTGYAVVEQPVDAKTFEQLARNFGRIMLETPVRLTPQARTYLSSPKPLPAHTDHPEVESIAWHCLQQDATDGATLLIDTAPILKSMDASAEDLSRVLLGCPSLRGLDPTGAWPLRWTQASRQLIYYAPWQRAQSTDGGARRAYEDFRALVEAAEPIHVRLTPGQALIIDNQRMLHGRGELDPASRRELRRLWLSNPPGPESLDAASAPLSRHES